MRSLLDRTTADITVIDKLPTPGGLVLTNGTRPDDLAALVVRTLLFQPFNIPSGSLIPTLLIGDYLFVSKYSYGYSKHSIPFSPPLFDGRIHAGAPERGDIVVFKLPRDNKTDYIKRLIGLPGRRAGGPGCGRARRAGPLRSAWRDRPAPSRPGAASSDS